MAKAVMSRGEVFELRHALQVAVLDALMSSRRWEPGELVFQGGTSLHLMHGSPRFSEDLDFLVVAGLRLDDISQAVGARLADLPWIPRGARLSVKRTRSGDNPHAFDVSIGGPDLIGGVRVRVEFRQSPASALRPLRVVVLPASVASGPGAGARAFVPTATVPEVYVDKVFALVARPYLKPRDVFDLYWLTAHDADLACTAEALSLRLEAYPNESAGAWLAKAARRREELRANGVAIGRDLGRWLPTSWPQPPDFVERLVAASEAALAQGVKQMELLASRNGSAPLGER